MKPYPKYKPSAIEWIGDIPSHWNTMRLKYAALVQPSNVDKKSHEDELPVLLCNYVDVYKNNFIDNTLSFMNATAKQAEIEKFKLQIGDVIITKDSETPEEIAIPALVKIEKDNLICGYHLTQIRSDKRLLTGNYLFYHFLSKDFNSNFEKSANGVTRFALSADTINGVHILLPEIAEQNAIAEFLDRKIAQIGELIEGKQKLIEFLKEERTAIINQAVTRGVNQKVKLKPSGVEWLGDIPAHWDISRLKYFTNRIGDGIHATPQYTDYTDYYFINGTNLVNGDIATQGNTRTVDEKEYLKLKLDINVGAVLLSLNGTIGKLAIYKGEKIVLGKSVSYIECSDIYNKYVYYILQSNYIADYFETSLSGTTIRNLSLYTLRNSPILVPPKAEQRIIVDYIEFATEKINNIISTIEKEIELMLEYSTALISEVVTGKVDITKI